MEPYYWDGKLDYLLKTRDSFYNDDYIEFLVKAVWKIDAPVHMIDFGCGYGFLGLKLLPLLTKGSKYTGVDAGVKLINHAKALFNDLPYEAEFIVGDIQELVFERKYDMAICHAFLMHTPNPKEILKKMLDCVLDQGRIICFESHWISAMANFHIDGIEQSRFVRLGLLQNLYESDANRSGKDGNIGIKLPVYMSRLGVKDIQCRVNDKVNFLNPDADPEHADKLYHSLRADGFGAHPGERETFIRNLMDRGVNENEALLQYENELFLSENFNNNIDLTFASNMKITSGRVER
jgi:SAM-dependent methyltransferase